MKLGVIEAQTIHELFINRMVGLILSGKLAIGEKLPTERELAEETKISKTAIHMALVELERLGFVEILPRKGTFVTNYSEKGTLDTLNVIMKYNGGNLTTRQIQSLFDARIAIEGSALRMLINNCSPEDIEILKSIIEEAEECLESSKDYPLTCLAEILFKFHHRICSLSGNLIFPLILNSFKPITLVFWETAIQVKGKNQNVDNLKKYLLLIKNKDLEGFLNMLSEELNLCLNYIKEREYPYIK